MSFCPPISLYDTGGRPANEDYIYPFSGSATPDHALFMVCDGVGGLKKGDVASRTVAQTIARVLEQCPQPPVREDVLRAVALAHQALSEAATRNPQLEGMATTLALAYLHGTQALIAHIGDSRVYHFRAGQVLWRTKDHSWVQEMMDRQVLTPEEARDHPRRNLITRAIQAGAEAPVPDFHLLQDLRPGDLLFLCSDGVGERIPEHELPGLLFASPDPERNLQAIYRLCSQTRGDNFSAWLIPIGIPSPDPDDIPTAEAIEEPVADGTLNRIRNFFDRINPFTLHDDE